MKSKSSQSFRAIGHMKAEKRRLRSGGTDTPENAESMERGRQKIMALIERYK